MNDKLTVIGSKFYQQCKVVMLPTEDKIKLKTMRIPTSETELGVFFEYDYDGKGRKLGYFLPVKHSYYHNTYRYHEHKEMLHITYQEFKKLYPIFLSHNKRITK